MMRGGCLWYKLQDVIKNEIEQCIGADVGRNSLHLGLIHYGLGANIMAINRNRFQCCEKQYLCFLLTLDMLGCLSFIIRKSIWS